MPDLRFLLNVSRPRFWFYIFGPYILGIIAGAATRDELLNSSVVFLAVYFLFPANLLIYGINDIFDYDTDILNEKKVEYETLVERDRHKNLIFAIIVANLPFLIPIYMFMPELIWSFLGFLFFSFFYSAPPIRAKTKPFLDSAFNILYIFPGIIGYQLMTDNLPPLKLLVAAGLWTAAMHAYSAIPDIVSDRIAGLSTIAIICGPFGTLAICTVLYVAAAVLSFDYLGFVSISLGLAYVILMLASIRSVKSNRLFKLYRVFPVINVIAGFILFWEIAIKKFL